MAESAAAAREALASGREALPAYADKQSRREDTRPQIFAPPAPRKFFKTDHRGGVRIVKE